MLKLDLYIHGAGVIATAADGQQSEALKQLASEPDYTQWIPPMQLRRTSKVVRMGIGAAKMCMTAAGMDRPDALSLGTAMGCLQDTEVFLNKMVNQEEKMLTPTAFIQSTHNTVGGQIALLMGCHGHNMTYVHRGHSFEHAIINTKLYLQDHPGQTVLAGGIDELTESSYQLMQSAGFYPKERLANGVPAGEGAAFFAINDQQEGALGKIVALHLFTAQKAADALAEVEHFMAVQNIEPSSISKLLMGNNGDQADAGFYEVLKDKFQHATTYSFKQDCGEYATATAYALSQAMPKVQSADDKGVSQQVIILNHYCDHYSCWLLNV